MFIPLPNDCIDYYPVEPDRAAIWWRLWSTLRRECKTEGERLERAYRAGLPRAIGMLTPHFASAFADEMTYYAINAETENLPYLRDDIEELSDIAAGLVFPQADQPLLGKVILSLLNFDRQLFSPEPAEVKVFFDNRTVRRGKVRVDKWHPDDGATLLIRPSRRITLRTAVPLTYRDGGCVEQVPRPNEILLMTGDTYHRSSEPLEPTPSKYLQIGIFMQVDSD